MKVLLDTNAFVALRQGREEVLEVVARADGVVMSTVVLGELLFGFRNGKRYRENFSHLRSFLVEPDVELSVISFTTAECYGRISASLRSRGCPIPTNDVWIAAQALETGIPVVSFDTHFRNVDGIELIEPGVSRMS